MISFEKTEVVGIEHTIRGMRNPMNSWEKSDSYMNYSVDFENKEDEIIEVRYPYYRVGAVDVNLMQRLAKAGTDHRKFMRMLVVYVDITAPLYWWKEFDTYKVGTVANSCSTMHKIHSEKITLDDFSVDNLGLVLSDTDYEDDRCRFVDWFCHVVDMCEQLRTLFVETKDERYWRALIQLLPESYNQKRTIMLNYEVLANIYRSRRGHKLEEWRDFCKWIESLPYSDIIKIGGGVIE